MQGTFATALAARQIKTGQGALTSEVRGEVETEDGVLVIRRIHVAHRLAVPESGRAVVEEVHKSYPSHCPLYRSLRGAIEITSSCGLVQSADTGPAT
jgi:organic hydroperoxide reductase OsmC/OhrA